MTNQTTDKYEKFVKDRGYEFKTQEELDAGYARLCKCSANALLTEEEFIAEATCGGRQRNTDALKKVYAKLALLVNNGKLKAAEVYRYARFGWCLNDADAIVAYEVDMCGKWVVNNCESKITVDEAILKINREWGFEASQIKIIGTPYYEATDWKFIRFDCARMGWLWEGHSLYQVIE